MNSPVYSLATSNSKKSSEQSEKSKKAKKKREITCTSSESSSHTKFYRKPRHEEDFKEITRREYNCISPTISSSDTFGCIHGPEGIQYDTETLLKRQFLKEVDPLTIPRKWNDECPPSFGWDIAEKIVFLIQDTNALQQLDRFQALLREFAKTSCNGYRVDTLSNLYVIVDYLMNKIHQEPSLKENFVELLTNITKPILLKGMSDVVKYFDAVRNHLGFMVYLLMSLEEDYLFDIISKAIIFHLSASDAVRGPNSVRLRHAVAAADILLEPTVRMLAIARPHRFPTYLVIALLLACHTEENCIDMMKENIIENIFYRFNPYFPYKDLPNYDINPADCQDMNVKLGDSSVHMNKTLTLLLILLKTTKKFLEKNPQHIALLPCPDKNCMSCFNWAYRYECRARHHNHERITLTVIAAALLKCFGPRLIGLSSLMPDIITLSVLTEIPPRDDWTSTVNFDPMQQDVLFKTILIKFVVDLLKAFPFNKFMVKSRYWILGLMYLIDPGLCQLRTHWSPALFAEIRKTSLQALVCTLPLLDPAWVKEYELIRRIMWYIEWYTEFPYEVSTLYWCVRLLQVAVYHRKNVVRETSIQDLFDTHGIIILMHLCSTILFQKMPPVEKSQAVLAVCLRLLSSSAHSDTNRAVNCKVYPSIKWPISINNLARDMLDDVLYCLERNFIVSDRWLISLLNFIWEGVIWKEEYRKNFVRDNGVYNLLDIVTMTRPPVQCLALALVCDVARAADAVGHLVTWRACLGASNASPILVKRGATVATLIAAVFRSECESGGIKLSEIGVLEDMEHPIMAELESEVFRNQESYDPHMRCHRTPACISTAGMAGSRMSKAFALLHMLSEDLASKADLADEAYNLYKNIALSMEDEAILVLCSNYLTLKLNEVWAETKVQSPGCIPEDEIILDEFLSIGKGWAIEIKQQQEDVIARHLKKESDEENSLYAFLERIRLNIALDALKTVRCVSRSADRQRVTHALLHDAVFGHHRRSNFAKKLNAPVIRTYTAPLDDTNMTGQNIKVYSILRNDQANNLENLRSLSEIHTNE
ncbi:unnamed protein product [Arctia plantaginis]|uniref:Cilia- and flagella-associated protein 69 ARM repeats domain-containing protein n=1 Tax=Arctia plantaginis TaxID=874455 RepID=A0A8S1BIC3_ARCPL|nr:unnamed protein product [Arctia plantaginis]